MISNAPPPIPSPASAKVACQGGKQIKEKNMFVDFYAFLHGKVKAKHCLGALKQIISLMIFYHLY